MSREKYFERKFGVEIERMGGLSRKFHSPSWTGMPDRVVLMPQGKTYWVEFKDCQKRLTARQEIAVRELSRRGHRVFVVNSHEALAEVLELIRSEQ